eukprot:Em0016g1161a
MNSASNELFPSDKERYDKKLQCLYGLGTYCDPFGIPDQHWVDDVSKWPPVDYPSIYNYTYFIETPGGYTRERLKAFKNLEAYNYYQRLGELCSHIGAVLFKVEACVRVGKESVTCTSLPCTWNQTFSTKINPALVVDIDFNSPKRLKPTTQQRLHYNYNDQLQLDRRFSRSIQLDFECALGNHFWLQPQMVSFLAAVVVKVCWRSNALSSIGIVNQPV